MDNMSHFSEIEKLEELFILCSVYDVWVFKSEEPQPIAESWIFDFSLCLFGPFNWFEF